MSVRVLVFGRLSLIVVGISLAIKLPDHMASLHLRFRVTAKQSSTAAVPFYIPLANG